MVLHYSLVSMNSLINQNRSFHSSIACFALGRSHHHNSFVNVKRRQQEAATLIHVLKSGDCYLWVTSKPAPTRRVRLRHLILVKFDNGQLFLVLETITSSIVASHKAEQRQTRHISGTINVLQQSFSLLYTRSPPTTQFLSTNDLMTCFCMVSDIRRHMSMIKVIIA